MAIAARSWVPRDGKFKLARQVGELGMERAPLTQNLGIGSRIDDFVACHPCKFIAGDIAYAVTEV